MKPEQNIIPFPAVWVEQEIVPEVVYSGKIGPLLVWMKKVGEEILIAHRYLENNDQAAEQEELPADSEWARWAIKPDSSKIQIHPLFPDRPVVVKPEATFRVVKGMKATVYVRVPLWIEISLLGKTRRKLTEIPTVILSKTWFGDFQEGELCYWISSSARRVPFPDPARPYAAICPIKISNEADEDLVVEKIRLNVTNLTLFDDGFQLWSDETTVVYKGENEINQIKVSHHPPGEASAARLIAQPRNPLKKGIGAKTFATLKDLPGFGMFIN